MNMCGDGGYDASSLCNTQKIQGHLLASGGPRVPGGLNTGETVANHANVLFVLFSFPFQLCVMC